MSDLKAEVYVDIKEAAQILNNVSIRTAYRYIDKGAVGLSIAMTTEVVNGFTRKLYRKEDIVNLAKALNKDHTVMSYIPINVRPSANTNGNGVAVANELTELSTMPVVGLTAKPDVRLAVGTLINGVLIITCLIMSVLIWKSGEDRTKQDAAHEKELLKILSYQRETRRRLENWLNKIDIEKFRDQTQVQ